jgi:hypothetical protein
MINLITDPNVITGTDTYGTIEGFGANAGGQLSSSTDQAHSGSRSLKTIVHSGNQNDGWYTDLWTVSPSTEYIFDLWFNGPVNEVIGLVIQESSGSQPSENVTLTDAEWDHFQFTFTTDSNTNAVRLATTNPNWDNFTYYSDDISLYQGRSIQLETIETNITLLDFANESILVLLESLENVITLVDFANTPRLVTLEILQATTSFTGLGIPTYLNTLESSISLEDITFTTSFPTIVNLDVFSSTSLLNNFTVYTVRNVIISLNALNPLINLNDVVIIAERILWGKLTDNLAEPLSSDCSLVYDIFRENVDQNQTIQNANIELGTSAYPQIAQIFQPSQSDLTGIGIWAMGTVGTPTGIITASIYEMNYDSRISLLQQWEIPNGFWGDNIETLIPFDLTLLDTTTSYAFALSIDTVDDDNYYILGTSLKKGGNLKYQTGQGNWNNYGGDLWFNSYYPINVYTNQTPPIDLSAIPYTAIKFRAKLSSKGIQENSNILVSEGFKQNVTEQGQLISVGAFDFDWDGSEKIYLASSYPSKPSSNLIWADDELIITTSKGSISVTCGSKDYKKGMVYPFVYFAPAPDISSLLEEGANHVEVFVQDIYGGYIGCSELHIIFTESNSDSPEINNWAITKEDVYT